ncbi:MAG: preprotein translocase subunit YajC [Pseudomonadota bacterium]
MFLDSVAHAMGIGGGGGGQVAGGAGFTALVPLILMFVVFYFLLIRPQQKRAKEHRDVLQTLKKGDLVITQGGLYGRITGLTDQMITLEIANNVEIKVVRSYVAGLAKEELAKTAG